MNWHWVLCKHFKQRHFGKYICVSWGDVSLTPYAGGFVVHQSIESASVVRPPLPMCISSPTTTCIAATRKGGSSPRPFLQSQRYFKLKPLTCRGRRAIDVFSLEEMGGEEIGVLEVELVQVASDPPLSGRRCARLLFPSSTSSTMLWRQCWNYSKQNNAPQTMHWVGSSFMLLPKRWLTRSKHFRQAEHEIPKNRLDRLTLLTNRFLYKGQRPTISDGRQTEAAESGLTEISTEVKKSALFMWLGLKSLHFHVILIKKPPFWSKSIIDRPLSCNRDKGHRRWVVKL